MEKIKEELESFIGKEIHCIKTAHDTLGDVCFYEGKFYEVHEVFIADTGVTVLTQRESLDDMKTIYMTLGYLTEFFKFETKVDIRQRKIESILDNEL